MCGYTTVAYNHAMKTFCVQDFPKLTWKEADEMRGKVDAINDMFEALGIHVSLVPYYCSLEGFWHIVRNEDAKHSERLLYDNLCAKMKQIHSSI